MNAAAEYFYHRLSPYGQWTWLHRYGWVWSPNHVSYGWRPYTGGKWVWTNYGWTWDSDHPWGWACFHYGRWFYDEDRGWLWRPGTVWSPAWVAWNEGVRWYGWAPLPPFVEWETRTDWDEIVPTYYWVFVDRDDFLRHHLRGHCLSEARNVTLLHRTRNIGRIRRRDGHLFDRGVPVKEVEKSVGRQVGRRRIVMLHSLAEAREFHARRNQLVVVHPSLEEMRESFRQNRAVRLRQRHKRIHERTMRGRGSVRDETRDFLRRQAAQRKRFYRCQQQQRERLERLHKHELRHRPKDLPYPELFEQQMNENRALDEEMERENHLFEEQRENEFHHLIPRFEEHETYRENVEPMERDRDRNLDEDTHQSDRH